MNPLNQVPKMYIMVGKCNFFKEHYQMDSKHFKSKEYYKLSIFNNYNLLFAKLILSF
jgi:hypothetical protein